jgi:drug/metabolite transporter (DMT)-like permease
MLGAYLLSTSGKSINLNPGDFYILLAALGFATASVLNKAVIKRDIHPNIVSFLRALMGFIITLLIAVVLGIPVFKIEMLSLVLLISLFQSGIYIYLNKTLSVASASYMTMMSMITPVTVAVFAIPIYGESLNLIQWIGAGMIVFAGIMTQVKGLANHN